MKKIFFTLCAFVLTLPFGALADFSRLDDNYGLAQQTSFADVVMSIIFFILGFTAVLAILMIVVAGILYMTSAGDQMRIDLAKRTLTYAIIGLVVVLISWVIVVSIGCALGAGGLGGMITCIFF